MSRAHATLSTLWPTSRAVPLKAAGEPRALPAADRAAGRPADGALAAANWHLAPLSYSAAAQARAADALAAGDNYAVFDLNLDTRGLRRAHIARLARRPRRRGARRQPLAGGARRPAAGAPLLQRPCASRLPRGPAGGGRDAAASRPPAGHPDHEHQGHDLPAGGAAQRHALADRAARCQRHEGEARHRPPVARDPPARALARPALALDPAGQRAAPARRRHAARTGRGALPADHGRAAGRRLDPLVERASRPVHGRAHRRRGRARRSRSGKAATLQIDPAAVDAQSIACWRCCASAACASS